MDTVCHPITTQETSVNTLTGVPTVYCSPAQLIFLNFVLYMTQYDTREFEKPREINILFALSLYVLSRAADIQMIKKFTITEPEIPIRP